jgi:hypothetical protein
MTSLKVTSGNNAYWYYRRRPGRGDGVRDKIKRIGKKENMRYKERRRKG